MISVSGCRKNLSGEQTVAALNGIDLQVGKKEFFVLLGPSGSGKTTLMRCIAGLEKPDAGKILDGKTVFSPVHGVMSRRKSGRSAWFFSPTRSGHI